MHEVPQLLLGKVSYSESVCYSCRAIKRLPGRVVSCIYVYIELALCTDIRGYVYYDGLSITHGNPRQHIWTSWFCVSFLL